MPFLSDKWFGDVLDGIATAVKLSLYGLMVIGPVALACYVVMHFIVKYW